MDSLMLSRPTVLVFEGEMLIAMEFDEQLRGLGFCTTAPKSIAEARTVIERTPLHFAFLDFGSGVGVAYLAPILAENRVRFAICSGYPQARVAALDLGVPFFTKPFSPGDLLSALSAFPQMVPTARVGSKSWGLAL